MKIAYIRSGAKGDLKAAQIETLEPYGIDKWVTETDPSERTMLKSIIGTSEKRDILYVCDLLRLARDKHSLSTIVRKITGKGIVLISLKENIDSSTETGKAKLEMIDAIIDFEKASIAERHAEGVAKAKQNGKYKGKKKKEIKNFKKYYDEYMSRKITKIKLAKELNISRGTLDRMIKDYEEKKRQGKEDMLLAPLQRGSKVGQLRFDDLTMELKEEREI